MKLDMSALEMALYSATYHALHASFGTTDGGGGQTDRLMHACATVAPTLALLTMLISPTPVAAD